MSISVLIRADATLKGGTGHVMRCLALAEVFRENGIGVTLASTELPQHLTKRWESEGAALISLPTSAATPGDAQFLAKLANEVAASWIILDGYEFGAEYQRRLKDGGCRVLCMDDFGHAEYYYADFVLNQNLHAAPGLYRAAATTTKLLLGPRYVLLRREFYDRPDNITRPIPEYASKLLVTLGGCDFDNVTRHVLESLKLVDRAGLAIRIVIGGSNRNSIELKKMLSTLPAAAELQQDPNRFSDLMSWADLAVSAAGTTVWELAFMRVPILAVVIADNQVQVAESLSKSSIGVNLGWSSGLKPENVASEVSRVAADRVLRAQMIQAGKSLIDGGGVYRVAQALGLVRLRLRRATSRTDSLLLWNWVNQEDTRRWSFNSDPISLATHDRWFEAKLRSPGSVIWIGYDSNDVAVGQIRFDCQGDDLVYASVSVSMEHRGRGYARQLVIAGVRKASRLFPNRSIHALIKIENQTSIRLFESAGFSFAGEQSIQGCRAYRYVF